MPTRLEDAPGANTADGGSPEAAGGASAPRTSFPMDADGGAARTRADLLDPATDDRAVPIDLRPADGAGQVARAGRGTALSAAPGPDGDSGGIRQLALAALDWMHDTLPWTAGKDAGKPLPPAPVPGDNLGLPVEAAATASHVFVPHPARPAAANNAAAIDPRNVSIAMPTEMAPGQRRALDAGPEDGFHRFLRFSRVVIGHPLTWLAIVLIAAVHILLTRASRRGK